MPLFEMTEPEAVRWSEQRQAGQRRYVLLHGLGWGVILLLLNAAWAFFDGGLSPYWTGLNIVLWPVAGIALYSVLWWVNERLFIARRRGAV